MFLLIFLMIFNTSSEEYTLPDCEYDSTENGYYFFTKNQNCIHTKKVHEFRNVLNCEDEKNQDHEVCILKDIQYKLSRTDKTQDQINNICAKGGDGLFSNREDEFLSNLASVIWFKDNFSSQKNVSSLWGQTVEIVKKLDVKVDHPESLIANYLDLKSTEVRARKNGRGKEYYFRGDAASLQPFDQIVANDDLIKCARSRIDYEHAVTNFLDFVGKLYSGHKLIDEVTKEVQGAQSR